MDNNGRLAGKRRVQHHLIIDKDNFDNKQKHATGKQ